MSKLENLSIRGIRSFNPKEKNTIEFFTPLTLIVGANGTGKTTIIECLKYITTGDMPLNTKGGAFIFDPKIAKEIDIKAEVKLQFRNNRNEVMFCSRSMQSSIKKASCGLKTLECSLNREFNGKEVLITTKLCDIDRDVPQHLGVSYSILENVIFCHQDESIWPIGDPTNTKKKLDDIFNSTKYNKALLGLKSTKKEITSDLKLKSQQLSFFLKEKLKRDDILKKIQMHREEIERKNTKLKAFGDEIGRIEENMRVIAGELRIYEKLDQNYKILKLEFDNCTKFISNFSYEILPFIDREGSIFKINEIEETLSSLNICNIEEEYSKVEKYRAKIMEEAQRNEENLNRIQNADQIIENLLIEKTSKTNTLLSEFECNENELAAKMAEIFEVIENNIKEKEAELEKDKEQLILQKTEQRANEISVGKKIMFINQYKDLKIRSEIEIKDISIDYEAQLDLEATVDELLEEISIKQNKMNDAFKQSEKVFKRNILEESIQKIKLEINGHSLIEIKREIDEKTDNLNKLKEQHKLIELDNHKNTIVIEQNANINKRIILEMKDLFEKLNCFNENIKNSTVEHSQLKAYELVKSMAEMPDLSNNNGEIIALKRIESSEFLNIDSLKDISSLISEIEDAKNKIENNKYASAIYKNFLNLGGKNKACPLCKKSMEENTMTGFNERLEGFLERLPESVKAIETKLANMRKSLEVFELQNKDIEDRNNIKMKIKQLIFDLAIDSVSDMANKDNIILLQSNIQQNQLILEELNQKYLNIINKKEQLKLMEKELTDIPMTVDIASIKEELNSTKHLLEEKRAELSQYNKDIKEKEKLIKDIQQEKENRANIKMRDDYLEELKCIKITDVRLLEELVATREAKVNKIKQRYMKRKMDVDMKTDRILEIDKKVKEIKESISILKGKISDNFRDETIIFNNQIINVSSLKNNKEYEKIRTQIIGHKNRIIKLTKDLELEKHKLMVIEENIKLKKAKESIINIEKELKSFNFNGYMQLRDKYSNYEEKRIKMGNSESLIKGELKQLVQTLHASETEAESYANSNKNYLKCALEIKTLELATEDIEKCINGLDKAIVDFHSTKIEDVNRTLRDLWSNTYKGNDIDYIELKSESSETRAYNYRMVMVKNGVELDMRGRSSAGQKMIASILFRIALADSFSSGCNVLALDEPTTNLDKENIESLAQTLSVIIKERDDFQLIVITHDEEFVQLLNREGTEYYYRLKRDSKGNSNIVKHSIYENMKH